VVTEIEVVADILSSPGHPNLLEMSRSIEVAVGRLTLKAWESSRKVGDPVEEPPFISSLRDCLNQHTAVRQGHGSEKTSLGANCSAGVAQADLYDAALPLDDLALDIDWDFWDDLIRNPD
jgi:hypothetical protein